MGEPISRRQFLGATAASFVALVGGSKTKAADKTLTLAELFKDIPLTDQYGKPIDPAKLFNQSQCLVLFGYEGCPMCEKISNSVAAIQQELIKQNKQVPIIVISVQPEEDRYREKDNPMRGYITTYYEKGVQQWQNEKLPKELSDRRKLGEKSYDEGKDKPQSGRILHVVCPPSAELGKDIETRMSFMTSDNAKQHSAFITLFTNGKQTTESYRGLDFDQEAPDSFTGPLAKQIAADIAAARSR